MAELKAFLAEKGLLIATHNAGKLKEIQQLLAPLDISCCSAADKQLGEPEENGSTFADNAMIKSVAALKATDMPSMSDDSGLVVPALGGDPGIYSARWAGPNKDFDYAMKSVCIALEAKKQPLDAEAYFVCVFSLALPKHITHPVYGGGKGGALPLAETESANKLASVPPPPNASEHEASRKRGGDYSISHATYEDTTCINIEGRVHGRLTFPPRGGQGFGYDPIFVANGMAPLTFAEIDPAEKQQISHRANAFKGFLEVLNS